MALSPYTRLVTARSRLQHQYYGIVCLFQLDKQVPSTILRDYLRVIYLPRRIINLSYFCLFFTIIIIIIIIIKFFSITFVYYFF